MTTLNTAVHMNTTLRLYERAYARAWWANVCNTLGGTGLPLLDLEVLARAWTFHGRRFSGRQTVALEHIVGTEQRGDDFDAHFRPRYKHTEERWRRVASAYLLGTELPPIELIQVDDVYFVRDGHHRISVAGALGQREIDAIVTTWDVEGPRPWQPAANMHTASQNGAPGFLPALRTYVRTYLRPAPQTEPRLMLNAAATDQTFVHSCPST